MHDWHFIIITQVICSAVTNIQLSTHLKTDNPIGDYHENIEFCRLSHAVHKTLQLIRDFASKCN
jgi:hypothetical protein